MVQSKVFVQLAIMFMGMFNYVVKIMMIKSEFLDLCGVPTVNLDELLGRYMDLLYSSGE